MEHGTLTWSRVVLDGVDVETFLVCRDEQEGRRLMLALMSSMGLQDVDIVFIEHRGPGARVRGRAYLHRPGKSHPFVEVAERTGEGRA